MEKMLFTYEGPVLIKNQRNVFAHRTTLSTLAVSEGRAFANFVYKISRIYDRPLGLLTIDRKKIKDVEGEVKIEQPKKKKKVRKSEGPKEVQLSFFIGSDREGDNSWR